VPAAAPLVREIPYADPIAAVIMWQDYAARGARASAASTGDPILDAVVR